MKKQPVSISKNRIEKGHMHRISHSGILRFLYYYCAALSTMSSPRRTNALSTSTSPARESLSPAILSVGLATVDYIAQVCFVKKEYVRIFNAPTFLTLLLQKLDHFPEPDEKMRSSRLQINGGGNAANTACTIGQMHQYNNVESHLLTGMGQEDDTTLLQELEQNNVHCIYERYPGTSPFSYIMVVTDGPDTNTRTCIHQPSTGSLSPAFVRSNVLVPQQFDLIHFDGRYPEAAHELLSILSEQSQRSSIISVDVERPREGLDEILREANIIICSSNYRNLVRGEDSQDFLDTLRKKAPSARIVVETLGSQGVRLYFLRKDEQVEITKQTLVPDSEVSQPGGGSKIKAPKVTVASTETGTVIQCEAFSGIAVVDTTGAGDSFIGGFLTAMVVSGLHQVLLREQTLNLKQQQALGHALRIGCRVACLKVQKSGARSGLKDLSSDSFLKDEFGALEEIMKESPIIAQNE